MGDRPGCELCARRELQLCQAMRHMRLSGAFAENEHLRNLAVAQAAGDKRSHFLLAWRESGRRPGQFPKD